MISVVVPIGPNPVYRQYIHDCLKSISEQTSKPTEVVIVDDQAHLTHEELKSFMFILSNGGIHLVHYKTPWLSGVAHAFNFGVALAHNELVFMLGSDDTLRPWCLMDCMNTYNKINDPKGYYYVDVQYSDTGETQNLACHAAMVTKHLWQLNGGFPVESALGAPDTILISIMLGAKGKAGHLHRVESDQPPYLYRRHNLTDTASRGSRYHGPLIDVRNTLTATWQPPTWVDWKALKRGMPDE